jgi:hypothetical protein
LVLEPVINRYRARRRRSLLPRRCGVFRTDAAFAKPEIDELLEADDIWYALRLPANQVFQRRIGRLLTRPGALSARRGSGAP